MPNNNKYFMPISLDDPNIEAIVSIIVGPLNQQRLNVAGTAICVKLPSGTKKVHQILKDIPMYNHKKVTEALNNDEWISPVPTPTQ